MENAELIKALKEDAEWAHGNEWETPITLGDHLDAAAAALEAADKRIAELEAAQRWISVSERLPEKPPDYFKDGHWWMVSGEDFIVADSDGKVYEAHWTYGCSHQNYFWYVNSLTPLTNITHWQPLPRPPQKGE